MTSAQEARGKRLIAAKTPLIPSASSEEGLPPPRYRLPKGPFQRKESGSVPRGGTAAGTRT